MEYQNLTREQKKIANTLDNFFIHHPAINRTDWIIALSFILNKYKLKRGKLK